MAGCRVNAPRSGIERDVLAEDQNTGAPRRGLRERQGRVDRPRALLPDPVVRPAPTSSLAREACDLVRTGRIVPGPSIAAVCRQQTLGDDQHLVVRPRRPRRAASGCRATARLAGRVQGVVVQMTTETVSADRRAELTRRSSTTYRELDVDRRIACAPRTRLPLRPAPSCTSSTSGPA